MVVFPALARPKMRTRNFKFRLDQKWRSSLSDVSSMLEAMEGKDEVVDLGSKYLATALIDELI